MLWQKHPQIFPDFRGTFWIFFYIRGPLSSPYLLWSSLQKPNLLWKEGKLILAGAMNDEETVALTACEAKTLAISRPIPLDAPVTKALSF